MPFIKPMLASPLPKGFVPLRGDWIAEEKYDGHRRIVEIISVRESLLSPKTIRMWSRDGLENPVPSHIRAFLELLPDGMYDGELIVPGVRLQVDEGRQQRHGHSGVKELKNAGRLVLVVFDLLALYLDEQTSTCKLTWSGRRQLLEQMFNKCLDPNHNGDEDVVANDRGCGNAQCFQHTGWTRVQALSLAIAHTVNDMDDVIALAKDVWARNGEGLILKRKVEPYLPGKRNKGWVKVKKLQTAVLKVIGFLPSTGQIVDNGPFAIAVLEDAEGNQCTVKVKDTKAREDLEKAHRLWTAVRNDGRAHPYIGRMLRIEYQERTPEGGYWHPRWDRWEDE